MKIFKELKKLGYKHYAECTIEELDNLPLNSAERISEQALVLRFFREKYDLDVISKPHIGKTKKYICDPVNIRLEAKNTYEEAELACLNKLIEIVKTKKL
jgi:hypothetical protein